MTEKEQEEMFNSYYMAGYPSRRDMHHKDKEKTAEEEKVEEYVNNIKFTFETELVQRIVKMFAKYAYLAGLHEGQKSKIIPCDRDNEHKWFAYKNLFETKWHIDYSVDESLPKCNTIKWFENKEAVMYYLVTNGMSYYEEAKGY